MEFNAEQKTAINHLDGPLLVIAGAGTGKTRVLTSRALYLIRKHNVPPDAILALTFTEKATEEMRARIAEGLPLGAPEVAVHTFHGFCDRVLRERGLEMGMATDYIIMSETEQWMFLKKHLYEFDLKIYRPVNNPAQFISALIGHFSRLRDEAVTPEAYLVHARERMKRASEDAERESAERQLELANAFAKYQNLLVSENVLDFGALTPLALRLLATSKTVLHQYQNRYRYIFVDEFQDTNFVQNKLVSFLAARHRNIMVVGDDDQSIYKWRGASVENIMQFTRDYPDARQVVLRENYRSTQPILNVAHEFIQANNPHRLEFSENVDKKLVTALAGRKNKKNAAVPEIHFFENWQEEVSFFIGAVRKMKPEDVCGTALLIRANAHAEPFLYALRKAGIPYETSTPADMMQFAAVKDLIAVLRAIANPRDSVAAFRFLSLSLFRIPVDILVRISRDSKWSDGTLLDAARKQPEPEIITALSLTSELLEFSREHKPSEVLRAFLEKTKYMERMRGTDDESLQNAEALNAFAELVLDYETRHADHSIIQFADYLDLLGKAPGRGAPAHEFLQGNGVKILTIHASKGLEFDTVFVANLVSGRFPAVSRREAFEIPADLINERLPKENLHLHEERRLLYVAITRARKRLFLTGSARYEGVKKWRPSPFIEELIATESQPLKISGIDEKKIAAIHERAQLPRLNIAQEIQTELFAADASPISGGGASGRTHRAIKLEMNKLSYSQLESFSRCPLQYQFRYLFSIPTPMSHHANFGISMHNALKEFYALIKAGQRPGAETIHELLDRAWIAHGYDGRVHEAERKAQGHDMLQRFFEKNEFEGWTIPFAIEEPFTLSIAGITLSGRIDRIDQNADKSVEIIDYKTGKVKTAKELRANLQLQIYALAVREKLGLQVYRISNYYLEPNEKISIEFSDAELDQLKTSLSDLIAAMRASDFSPTPGYHCSSCDYRLLCPAAKVGA